MQHAIELYILIYFYFVIYVWHICVKDKDLYRECVLDNGWVVSTLSGL